jgi:hypothetical protein
MHHNALKRENAGEYADWHISCKQKVMGGIEPEHDVLA